MADAHTHAYTHALIFSGLHRQHFKDTHTLTSRVLLDVPAFLKRDELRQVVSVVLGAKCEVRERVLCE